MRNNFHAKILSMFFCVIYSFTAYSASEFVKINLHMAVKYNLKNIVVELLNRGADPYQEDYRGNTPMSLAVEATQINLVRLLSEALPADCDNLHTAIDMGHLTTIKLLLDRGPDVLSKDQIGKDAFYYAYQNEDNNQEIISLLYKYIKDSRNFDGDEIKSIDLSLAVATRHCDFKRMKDFIAAGADVNQPDQVGFAPLTYAAINNNFTATQILLKANAKPIHYPYSYMFWLNR